MAFTNQQIAAQASLTPAQAVAQRNTPVGGVSPGAAQDANQLAQGQTPTPVGTAGKDLSGATPVNTAQPSPTTANATPTTGNSTQQQAKDYLARLGYTNPDQKEIDGAMQNLPASQDLSQKYKTGLASAQASKIPAPDSKGAASAVVQQNTPTPQNNTDPGPTETVQNFGQTNPFIQESSSQLMEFLMPANIRNELNQAMSTLVGERQQLAGINLELANVKNIMSGTENDIRTEVTAANGFATDSQVQAMAIGRNKVLLKQATLLQDQASALKDAVATDTTLLNFEKDQANSTYTQRLGLLNFQQQSYKDNLNAVTDSYNNIIKTGGYAGLLASMKGNAQLIQNYEQMSHLAPGGLQQLASQPNTDQLLKDAQLRNINSEIAARNVSNQGDPAVSENTLQGMLNVYKSTGVIPSFGLSAKNPLRAQFYAALGSDGGIVTDANTNKTVRAGLNTAYKTQQNLYSANQTAVNTLDKQLTLAQGYRDQVGDVGSPLVNKYKQSVQSGVFGDPQVAALHNIVQTASYEFAKILSGASASISGVTVNSQADAETMLNSAMTKGQFTEIIGLMRKEAGFRLNTQKDTLTQLQGDLNNIGKLTESLKPIAPVDIPSGYYQASDGLLYKK